MVYSDDVGVQSKVLNSGQVTRPKYRKALPKAVVVVSKSLSDVSVWIWSFARVCHVAKMNKSSITEVL